MKDSLFDIEKELRKLPETPGVYIMYDSSGNIIYIGKARNLHNRVRQYFQSRADRSAKIKRMISLIERFDYIEVDSEAEALVLENNLIKEKRPKYNTLLKDDKTYPSIKVSLSEDFPRVTLTRNISVGKDRFFGPFPNAGSARNTVTLVNRLFRLPRCRKMLEEGSLNGRPCIYFSMGECLAPCTGDIDKTFYRRQVDRALSFLSGRYSETEKYLRARMKRFSENEEFEKALEAKKSLDDIGKLKAAQKLEKAGGHDRDIVGISRKGGDALAAIFLMRGGRMTGRNYCRLYTDSEEPDSDILTSFLMQYYMSAPLVPGEILLQSKPKDPDIVSACLEEHAGKKVHLSVPERGEKKKLVLLAARNALDELSRELERKEETEKDTETALKEISVLLDIPFPERIEAYDISNIGGDAAVGSMTVFLSGNPAKTKFRKFRIKSVSAPDDYASMREMLSRRFQRYLDHDPSFSTLPDLILMDGGKGQVGVCIAVMEEFDLSIPTAGMVKDSKHRTRGLVYAGSEISLDGSSPLLKLLARIQDETHAFAIGYHRRLRNKQALRSVLDDIPGIGEKRKISLMRHFGDIEKIRNASVEELRNIDKMNAPAAEKVYEFFHGAFVDTTPVSN